MKKTFINSLFFLLFFSLSQAQLKEYTFNIVLDHYDNAPSFTKTKDLMYYSGKDSEEDHFFSNYRIIDFHQTYPHSTWVENLSVFTFVTYDESMMTDIVNEFPSKYLRFENLTDQEIQLAYYPDDYGTFSPVTNLGANLDLRSLDYINTPKAWDYTTGVGSVKIGISDGKIKTNDADFTGKTTYLNESQFYSNYTCNSDSAHGTSVGAIAAAKGDNAHGMLGVCYDCDIINVPYSNFYDGLLLLAENGVKVINMSWVLGSSTTLINYNPTQQSVIDELHSNGVVLVAAAGNENPYVSSYAPNYNYYRYPASYNHVISVTCVNYKNANFTDQTEVEGGQLTSKYNKDLISSYGLLDGQGNFSPVVFNTDRNKTTNTAVDICAPGYQSPLYTNYDLGCGVLYGNATSCATPYVTGTVGLMFSLNQCLLPDEIEDIIQLTSKNLESNVHNQMYVGRSGSGKLETGDAVEFTYEMIQPNGNAVIDGQDFWRFTFDLQHINNKLSISNQTFRDNNVSNFLAKNEIKILSGTTIKPNQNGSFHIGIKSDINVSCTPASKSSNPKNITKKKENPIDINSVTMYPNPSNSIVTFNSIKERINKITIFSLDGKQVINQFVNNLNEYQLNVSILESGIYLVNIETKEGKTFTQKLIKN